MAHGAPSRSDARWRRLRAEQKRKRLPCFWCGQPIEYDKDYPHPASFTADHVRPWERHPELRLDPGNVVSAHASCNWAKNDSEHFSAGLGELSEEF